MSELCWKIENDICRCCHGEGSFANLAVPQSIDGREEVYADMLRESLDINLVQVEGEMNNMTYTICGICIMRLRDAFMFKQQVLQCEDKFQEMYAKKFIQVSLPLKTSIKVELIDSDSADDEFILRDTDKDEDNDEIITTKIKQEKADAPEKKRLRPRKVAEKPKKAPMLKKMLTKKTQLKKKKKEEEEKKESEAEKNSVDREYYYEVELQCLEDTKDPLVTKIKKEEEEESPPQEQTRQGTAESLVKEEGKVDTKKKKGDGVAKKRKPRKAETVPRKRKEPKQTTDYTELINEGQKRYLCHKCHTTMSSLHSMKRHIENRHVTNVCPVCDEQLPNISERRLHLYQKHNMEEAVKGDKKILQRKRKWTCEICETETEFSSPHTLKTHVQQLHTLHMCQEPGCDVELGFKDLMAHRHEVHGIPKPTCGACSYSHWNKALVDKHIRAVHLQEKNYACNHCDKMFYDKEMLGRHMIKHNKNVLPYTCSYCCKKFSRNKSLVEHENIHKGVKNKVCPVCGERFGQRTSLKYHMNKHHPGAPVPSSRVNLLKDEGDTQYMENTL